MQKIITTQSSQDTIIFPRDHFYDDHALALFKEAYAIDLADNGTDVEEFLRMMHLYLDAFNGGIMAAGVNILRVLSQYHVKISNDVPGYFPFQQRMTEIIDTLKAHGHPAGDYYETVALIYGTMQSEGDAESDMDQGIAHMYALANGGHPYATAWVDYIESDNDAD